MKMYVKNHDYRYAEIPKEDHKMLKCNHGEKSMKAPFIIYVDMESLLKKISTFHNSPKKSSTIRISKHTPSGCSLFTHCLHLIQQKVRLIIIEVKTA